ncbi:uncharacterized protein LY79DRAFT_397754 [Colletotrichum navitas]|uniref:Uncharacterized protein n=1 Tax=Colletotrichum navitas TaxID=681940 RepID=A0AAD8PQC3_9PEZI|nr:uncharacterized protein LY79DRAFT_397754 [Colletotrichum navitas]KAK1573829.1 hypothetical protein LY79DRAFT_397754 [Colletotrichum navitas]
MSRLFEFTRWAFPLPLPLFVIVVVAWIVVGGSGVPPKVNKNDGRLIRPGIVSAWQLAAANQEPPGSWEGRRRESVRDLYHRIPETHPHLPLLTYGISLREQTSGQAGMSDDTCSHQLSYEPRHALPPSPRSRHFPPPGTVLSKEDLQVA